MAFRATPAKNPEPVRHALLTYPVNGRHQGEELARRLQSTLARLTSSDATFVALVTAQAVTVSAAFHPSLDAHEINTTLVPTLTALITGAMVNDLVCRHLEKVKTPRFKGFGLFRR